MKYQKKHLAMNKRFFISAACLVILSFLTVSAQSRVDISDPFVLENEHVSFEFEPEHMGLLSMTDLSTMHNHINPVEGKHLLWEVAFAKGKQIYTITNNISPAPMQHLKSCPTEPPGQFWSGIA